MDVLSSIGMVVEHVGRLPCFVLLLVTVYFLSFLSPASPVSSVVFKGDLMVSILRNVFALWLRIKITNVYLMA